MDLSRTRSAAVLVLALAVVGSGCSAHWPYRKGQRAAEHGDWDMAVAQLTKALRKHPNNLRYKIAVENARIQASRQHYDAAKKHLAADALDKAAEELQIAAQFDPSNKSASDDLLLVREKIRRREEEKQRLSEFEAMKTRAQAARVPVPVLSARSAVPLKVKFIDSSLEKILETLGKLSGVNILFDETFKDKRTSVDLSGVTFEEALNQITFVNRLFYKVLDQNTLIIVPDSAVKRRTYDELLIQTFYLQNSDATEMANLIKGVAAMQKVVPNVSLSAVTVLDTPDNLAIAARIIETNDKAKGEVVVEVQILDVNRHKLKQYGIELSAYQASSTFAPTGNATELASGLTAVRAHMLSSINLADFVVNIPSTLLTRFLQNEDNARLLAAPRLRAAEGKKASLRIGNEVPIPVTTFTASQAGTSTYAPATSFTYKNVGVSLDITPKVNPNGDISLEMAAEFSTIGADRNVGNAANPLFVPTFKTRNVTGMLRLHDGETSLIGGLLQRDDTYGLSGILGLEGVPLLNKLLSSTKKETDETEILISITPHLVRAPKVSEDDMLPLFTGTQDVKRVTGARPPLFGAPEDIPPSPSPKPAPASPAPAGRPSPPPASVTPLSSAPPAVAPEGQAPAPFRPAATNEARRVSAMFSSTEQSVKPGEIATVSLVVIGARDLTGVEVVLVYDAAVLEAVEVAPGPLLTLDGSAVGTEKGLEAGRVRAHFTRPSGTSGSGAVASLRLKALRAGPGQVGVESLTLTTAAGAEPVTLPGNAIVQVQP